LKDADLSRRGEKNLISLEPRLKPGVKGNAGLAVFARTDTACSAEGHLGAQRSGALFMVCALSDSALPLMIVRRPFRTE
jgi:hypothetical protein